MKSGEHIERARESLDEIRKCVRNGIEKHQRTIGFHISAAMVDMLEAYLHENHLIDPGTIIKHDWFTSRRVMERLPDFENRKRIIEIMLSIEEKRNKLCYGRKQGTEVLSDAIHLFYSLKEIFESMGVYIEEK
jgi:hypothetical protein